MSLVARFRCPQCVERQSVMSQCSKCGLEQPAEELTPSGVCALPRERMEACEKRGLQNLVKLWRREAKMNKRQAGLHEPGHNQGHTLGEASGLELAAKQLSEYLKK